MSAFRSLGSTTVSILATTAAAWLLIGASPPWMAWTPICGGLHSLAGLAFAWVLLHSATSHMAAMWMLMFAAMMPPLVLRPLDHVSRQSFIERRGRAATLFFVIYAAIWAAAGVPIILIAATLNIPLFGQHGAVIGAALVAIAWQISPAKQRFLNRCHLQPPLRAFGWAADADVVRFGFAHAVSCVGACWPLMLLAEAAGAFHLPVMVSLALFAFAERFESPRRPAWGWNWPGKLVRLAFAQARVNEGNLFGAAGAGRATSRQHRSNVRFGSPT